MLNKKGLIRSLNLENAQEEYLKLIDFINKRIANEKN